MSQSKCVNCCRCESVSHFFARSVGLEPKKSSWSARLAIKKGPNEDGQPLTRRQRLSVLKCSRRTDDRHRLEESHVVDPQPFIRGFSQAVSLIREP
jgi:hypothetical protein